MRLFTKKQKFLHSIINRRGESQLKLSYELRYHKGKLRGVTSHLSPDTCKLAYEHYAFIYILKSKKEAKGLLPVGSAQYFFMGLNEIAQSEMEKYSMQMTNVEDLLFINDFNSGSSNICDTIPIHSIILCIFDKN